MGVAGVGGEPDRPASQEGTKMSDEEGYADLVGEDEKLVGIGKVVVQGLDIVGIGEELYLRRKVAVLVGGRGHTWCRSWLCGQLWRFFFWTDLGQA